LKEIANRIQQDLALMKQEQGSASKIDIKIRP